MREKEKPIKSCVGCKNLSIDKFGSPDCINNFEKICFRTNFILWEARENDDKKLAYPR